MRRVGYIFFCTLALAGFLGAAPATVSEDDRLSSLTATSRESALLPESLLEAAKIHYRRARWSEFFGLATYARVVFPKSVPAAKLATLEAMALLRHCQFDKARALVVGAPVDAGAPAEWKRARVLVAEWLELTKDAHVEVKTEDLTKRPKPLFDAAVLWPVGAEADALKKLDPFGLRRKVEPLCPAGGQP